MFSQGPRSWIMILILVRPPYFIISSYSSHVWSWLNTIASSFTSSSIQLFLFLWDEVIIFQFYQLATSDFREHIPTHVLPLPTFYHISLATLRPGSLLIHRPVTCCPSTSPEGLQNHSLQGPFWNSWSVQGPFCSSVVLQYSFSNQ